MEKGMIDLLLFIAALFMVFCLVGFIGVDGGDSWDD
jgi:hypothetical protein